MIDSKVYSVIAAIILISIFYTISDPLHQAYAATLKISGTKNMQCVSKQVGLTKSFTNNVASAGNNMYVVWSGAQNLFNPHDIVFQASANNGDTFNDAIIVGSGNTPEVKASGNYVYVVWEDNAKILLSASNDTGADFNFTDSMNLSGNSPSVNPHISVSGNYVYVTWTSLGNSYLIVSTDNGATFGTPVNLTSLAGGAVDPKITTSGKHIYITWAGDGFPDQALFRASKDNGTTFGDTINLSNDPSHGVNDPQIAAAGDNVFVTWSSFGGIFLAESHDDGVNFDSNIIVNPSQNMDTRKPQLTISGNNVNIVWQTEDINTNDQLGIFFSTAEINSASFGQPINLGSKIRNSFDPHITSSGGTVYISWINETPHGSNMAFRAISTNLIMKDFTISAVPSSFDKVHYLQLRNSVISISSLNGLSDTIDFETGWIDRKPSGVNFNFANQALISSHNQSNKNLTISTNANPDVGKFSLFVDGTGKISCITNELEIPVNIFSIDSLDKDVTMLSNTQTGIVLAGADGDGEPVTFQVVSDPNNIGKIGPSSGILSGAAPNLVYAPNPGFLGTDQFFFKVNDGTTDSNIAQVSIHVNNPPPPPPPIVPNVGGSGFQLSSSEGADGIGASSCGCVGEFTEPDVQETKIYVSSFNGLKGQSPDGKYEVDVSNTPNPDNSAAPIVHVTVKSKADGSIKVNDRSPASAWGFSPNGAYFVISTHPLGYPQNQFSLDVYDLTTGADVYSRFSVTIGLPGGSPVDESGDDLDGPFGDSNWGFSDDGSGFLLHYSDPSSLGGVKGQIVNLKNLHAQDFHLGDFTDSFKFSPCGDILMVVRAINGFNYGSSTPPDPVNFYFTADGSQLNGISVVRDNNAKPDGTSAELVKESDGITYGLILTGLSPYPANAPVPYPQCSIATDPVEPVNIVMTDQFGRKTGFDPNTNSAVNQIPGSTYSGVGSQPQIIKVPYLPGGYATEAFGFNSLLSPQDYHLSILGIDGSGQVIANTTVSNTASAGSIQSLPFSINLDLSSPVVKVPKSIVTNSTDGLGKQVSFNASAHDSVDGDLVPDCNPVPGFVFPIGTTKVTCTATDLHGNMGNATFTVTVKQSQTSGSGPSLFCGKPSSAYAHVINGTNGNDKLNGTNDDDLILGNGGNDTITGNGGNDCLIGGAGDDRIFGGAGNDTIMGGDGNDYINGETGDDKLYGGAGNDEIHGSDGNDYISGDKGDDKLYGGAGNDEIHGGDGNDYINGDAGDDKLYGGNGNDTIHGGDGNDYINGDAGDDKIFGESGNDTIHGGDGNDYINGDAGDDKLYGESGNDEIHGLDGNDYLEGDAGDDKLYGGNGNDEIHGMDGNDTIAGDAGDDKLYGGDGNDTISGGEGNDKCVDVLGTNTKSSCES